MAGGFSYTTTCCCIVFPEESRLIQDVEEFKGIDWFFANAVEDHIPWCKACNSAGVMAGRQLQIVEATWWCD